MKKLIIVLIIVGICAIPVFSQKETNYDRLRAFTTAIGDVSTTIDELISRHGNDFILEELYVTQEDFPNSEEGSKIFKYSFKNGAVFFFYQNPGKKPFLMTWIVPPGFSPSITIPATIEACRRWFGKEQVLLDDNLYYFFEWTLVFTFEKGQLVQVSWSSYN